MVEQENSAIENIVTENKTPFQKFMSAIPQALSSTSYQIFMIILFLYLFVYAGIETFFLKNPNAVSQNAQLILGNETNVSSALGSAIAAGAGLTALKHSRKTHRLQEETHRLIRELHLARKDNDGN